MDDEPLSPTKAKKAQRKRQRERLLREAAAAKKIAGAARAKRRRAEAERDALRDGLRTAIGLLDADVFDRVKIEPLRALAASVSKEEAGEPVVDPHEAAQLEDGWSST